MFVLFLKDNIAVAKSRVSNVSNVDRSMYDNFEEITEEVFNVIELPSKKINDVWTKTIEFPVVEYPTIEVKQEEPTAIEQLKADIDFLALMTGVEL